MINIFYRFEFKYKIPKTLARTLAEELRHFGMEPDTFAAQNPEKSYPVTSIYFDSPDFSDYYDKAGGYLERKKIRGRIYEPYLKESKSVWLEMKMKRDVSIKKERLTLSREEWRKLNQPLGYKEISNAKTPGERKILENIFFNILKQNMKPQTIIRYKRTPLIYKHVEQMRVTFDENLEACLSDDLGYNGVYTPYLSKDQVIMEVKFRTLLPSWLRDMIVSFNLKRISYSKYAEGMEALNKYIPAPR